MSEVMSRQVPDGVPNDSVAVVDAFAVGEFYVRCSGIEPGELPLVIGAGAIGLSDGGRAGRARRRPDRRVGLQRRPARVRQEVRRRRAGQPGVARPVRGVARDVSGQQLSDDRRSSSNASARNGLLQSIVDSCEFMARVYAAGGWYDAGTIDCTDATHKGMTIQFGGGPHPQDWYGTLDAVVEGRLDPSPSIGRVIGLDEVPDAIDQVRKGQGPPRVVVHPSAS